MSGSKTIAKNTLFLYVRMLLSMGVTLYSSRVVLQILGVEDYGVYSIVGGVVSMFSFFNSAMSAATQRFLTFDIGRKDQNQLRNTFNATFFIHIGIAVLILILAETLGLWFVNNKLNVPEVRIEAVHWVYQFSILTFLFGVIQVPFNALIIARERMNVYAIMSIVEVVLKLAIIYILVIYSFDKLKLYSALIFVITLLITLFYSIYCRRNFIESKFKWYYDKEYFHTLIAYSGWNLFGNIAAVARWQGINMILNLFFGVIVNAAYGIMMQVHGAVNSFVTNFQLAVNPQIIKSYASGETERMMRLIFISSKFSFFLVLLIIIPIIYNINFVLTLWLETPPDYSISFIRLCLVNVLIDCISGPLMTGAQATGKIKWYQIVVGFLVFLNLPVSYVFILATKDPNYIFYVSIIISVITLNFRLYFLKRSVGMSIRLFYKKVIFRIGIVSTLVFSLLFLLSGNCNFGLGFETFVFESMIILFVMLVLILFLGTDKMEKTDLKSGITKILKRWLSKI